MPVDGGLAHTGTCRHVLQTKTREPFLDQHLAGGVQDGPMRPVASGPSLGGARCCAGSSRTSDGWRSSPQITERGVSLQRQGADRSGSAAGQAAMPSSRPMTSRSCRAARMPRRNQTRRPDAGRRERRAFQQQLVAVCLDRHGCTALAVRRSGAVHPPRAGPPADGPGCRQRAWSGVVGSMAAVMMTSGVYDTNCLVSYHADAADVPIRCVSFIGYEPDTIGVRDGHGRGCVGDALAPRGRLRCRARTPGPPGRAAASRWAAARRGSGSWSRPGPAARSGT